MARYATDGGPPPPPTPAVSDPVLIHATMCACQLLAFTAVVYVLSAFCGVHVVRVATCHGGRRTACHRYPGGPLSEPVTTRDSDSADGLRHDGGHPSQTYADNHVHYRRRKIRSAAPLLQR